MESFSHLSCIRARGADAASFLQGQLSNDFLLLPNHQWQLAAYCTPKGRMLASFWGIKFADDDIVLVISRDIAAQTQKRLSMYILRAKVTLALADELLPELFARYELGAWANNEVARGVARITAPLVDLFVPQMLNYESISGVSFKKGCYPGQEVVARSQFRGAIKRRTYLVEILPSMPTQSLDTPTLAIGQEVFAEEEAESVGLVLQVDGNLALICMQTSSASSGLRVSTKSTEPGAALKVIDLPYPLLDDI